MIMATKTIMSEITLISGGVYHPPGTPVTIDAEEADSILARFGGEEVSGDAELPKGKKVAKA